MREDFCEWAAHDYTTAYIRRPYEYPELMQLFIEQAGRHMLRQKMQLYMLNCFQCECPVLHDIMKGRVEFTTIAFGFQMRLKYSEEHDSTNDDKDVDNKTIRRLCVIDYELDSINCRLTMLKGCVTCETCHIPPLANKTPSGGWYSNHIILWRFPIAGEERETLVRYPGRRDFCKFEGLV
jgi:hypothetical protein